MPHRVPGLDLTDLHTAATGLGAEAVVPALHRRLAALERRRPAALSLRPIPGDVEATGRALLAVLDVPPESS